ncbi:hypothetical protein LCGC14_1605000 [marine sediment metagenome]|uniref:Uncharacterized protein n=1 Tax=marine sediment metagenome TaxID=412755 RepID=A0A0F9IWL7_9ZZZZ
MLLDVTFDCLRPRFSSDASDQYKVLMELPDMVDQMRQFDYRLPPLFANITACVEWIVLDDLYLGLVWLENNDFVSFERLVPEGLVTIDLSDGPRFSDRPCMYLPCI